MRVVPIAPRLATATDWSGPTRPVAESRIEVRSCSAGDHEVDLGEAELVEPRLERGEDLGQVLAQLREVIDELGDAGRQRLGDEHDQRDHPGEQQEVDDHDGHHARQPRHVGDDPAHDRAQHEGDQPGQEERSG